MEFTGRYHISAPPEAVWAALNDPEVLKACVSGCEKLEKTSPTEFVATVTLKIGPMTARFGGKINLAKIDAPYCCTVRGEGSGAAGFAKGDAAILLVAAEGGTELSYTAKAAIGGKLAQIGQRLLDGAARQIAADFFRRLDERIGPPPDIAPASADIGAALPVPSASPAVPQKAKTVGSIVWIAGLIGVVVILLILLGLVL